MILTTVRVQTPFHTIIKEISLSPIHAKEFTYAQTFGFYKIWYQSCMVTQYIGKHNIIGFCLLGRITNYYSSLYSSRQEPMFWSIPGHIIIPILSRYGPKTIYSAYITIICNMYVQHVNTPKDSYYVHYISQEVSLILLHCSEGFASLKAGRWFNCFTRLPRISLEHSKLEQLLNSTSHD